MPFQHPKIDPRDLANRLVLYGADATEAARIAKVPATLPDPRRSERARRNRRKGLAVEGEYGGKGITAVLRSEGYIRFPNPGGKTAADVVARRAGPHIDGPPLRAVQGKRVQEFVPWALNDAVARFLGLGRWREPYAFPDGPRESWLWVDYESWVCRAILAPDDALTVTGPRAKEVERSLFRMLDIRHTHTRDDNSLKRRLGVLTT